MKRLAFLLIATCAACGDDDESSKPDVSLTSIKFDVVSGFYRDGQQGSAAPIPDEVSVFLVDRSDACGFYKSSVGLDEDDLPDLAYVQIDVDRPALGPCALGLDDGGEGASGPCRIDVALGKLRSGESFRLDAVSGSLDITRLDDGELQGELRVRFPVDGKDTLDCGSGGGGDGEPQDPTTCTCVDAKGVESTCETIEDSSCCNRGAKTEELVLDVGVSWCASVPSN